MGTARVLGPACLVREGIVICTRRPLPCEARLAVHAVLCDSFEFTDVCDATMIPEAPLEC